MAGYIPHPSHVDCICRGFTRREEMPIVGKIRMAMTTPLNHWWHVTERSGLSVGQVDAAVESAGALRPGVHLHQAPGKYFVYRSHRIPHRRAGASNLQG